MNILKHSSGSILLETLISIVLLGLIVIGSFYSYSIFQKRILAQRQQRIVLGILQGWMEQTMSSLMDSNNPLDPNVLINPIDKAKKENEFMEQFKTEIPSIFDPNTDIDPNIVLDLNNDKMITIRIRVTLNDLPITLYTEINPEK